MLKQRIRNDMDNWIQVKHKLVSNYKVTYNVVSKDGTRIQNSIDSF